MPLEFVQATPDDLPAIIDLLCEAFSSQPDAPTLDRAFLYWKLFAPGPHWYGSRSYVLRDGAKVRAHAVAWPVSLRIPSGQIDAVNLVDWAGRREMPGSGVAIAQRFLTLAPVVLSIGGTETTRNIMPRIGFPKRAELPLYVRIVRPFSQYLKRPGARHWKDPLRLVRNAVWSTADLASSANWTARPVDRARQIKSGFNVAIASMHSRETLEWILSCPAMPVQIFELEHSAAIVGYALIATYTGQARILDLRIESNQPEHWYGAFAKITETARQDPAICEVIACGSLPMINRALEANGYKRRDPRPVWVSDKQKLLPDPAAFWLSFLDNDDAFLPIPSAPFAT